MKDLSSRLIATCCGIGYFPAAPGTCATIAGLGLVYVLKDAGWIYLAVIVILCAAGMAAAGHLEKVLKEKDPGIVVIDEVVGIMIAMAGLPITWPVVISGFFLFRAFDMFKIYPINRCEAIPGGRGILLDDVVAGIYTNIVLSIAVRWAGII